MPTPRSCGALPASARPSPFITELRLSEGKSPCLLASARSRVLELLRRPLLGLTAIGGAAATLSTLYLATSAVITDRATRATRTPVDGTPADVNLHFEEVAFPSAIDHV